MCYSNCIKIYYTLKMIYALKKLTICTSAPANSCKENFICNINFIFTNYFDNL